MNLCIDIGNTTTKAAIFKDDVLIEFFKPFTADDFKKIKPENFRILVSKTGRNTELEKLLTEEVYLTDKTSLPIELEYITTETLGSDRISAAVGAFALNAKSTWLIIDMGTCLTMDLLRYDRFLGGMISPGISMRYKAMHEYTAGLPLVEHDDNVSFPGKSTEQAIQIGVSLSIKYEIMGYIGDLMKTNPDLKIIFCDNQWIDFDKETKNEIFAHPNLVLEGLNYIIQHHV